MHKKKAFDQANWEFLYGILQEFGFHLAFIKTIQAFFNSPRIRIKIKIKINGAISNSFVWKEGPDRAVQSVHYCLQCLLNR